MLKNIKQLLRIVIVILKLDNILTNTTPNNRGSQFYWPNTEEYFFYIYQILTAFNKIMSKVAHDK